MRRDLLLLFCLAIVAGLLLMVVIDEPGYTDAYYYYNAGHRLATGHGLTDPYLWNYLYLPDDLPAPGHTYWMPLTSYTIRASMALLGTTFRAAQVPSLLALAGLTTLTGWLGAYLGGGVRRYIWLPALLVLLGGFFMPFWVTSDSFALYGLWGAGAIVTMGLAHQHNDSWLFVASGGLGGLAHLTRADGLLLVIVALVVIWWPFVAQAPTRPLKPRLRMTGALLAGYVLIMSPWFIRNLRLLDRPLPSGGVNTMFLRGYNDLFAYPVDWSVSNFLDWGMDKILKSRWEALYTNFGTWLAVECFILLAPLALAALWKRRGAAFLTGFWVYALALHLVMTLVFAYPGYRGGLFHSSAALMPFWAVLGILGLDEAIEKMVRWRNWKREQARPIFGTATVVIVGFLALTALGGQLENRRQALDYRELAKYIPTEARVMANDPAAWYYHTGLWGVTLPDAPLEDASAIARRYCITYLVLDKNVTDSFKPLIHDRQPPPDFLEEVQYLDQGTRTTNDDVRIYRFTLDFDVTHCPALQSASD